MPLTRSRRRRTALIVASTVLATVACVMLVVNFTGGEKKIERRIERLYALDDTRFAHELGTLLGPPFLAGTRQTALRNGDEIFPAMLAAIQAARTSITFETYIYWSGDIGRQFAAALAERARGGCLRTGATPTFRSRARWWRRCSRCSSTTGSR